ncbi:MAG: hypothetical protein IJ649_08245 [Oscillospiraceae bacterium]|nr:hypothetical protein [Oscillospiraceae bacterium]
MAYYEYYDCEVYNHISFTSASGKEEKCTYYLYFPKGTETDETTPVVAYVTHGGGVAEEERANALHWAAGQDTEAIFVIPYTDKPEAVCASIEDAKDRLNGKGDFDAVSAHGTSSGGRAVIRAALKSTDKDTDYSFRFANVIAYDPAEESETANITGQTEAMRALAQQGTILFIVTDTGHAGGSGDYCNRYAQCYSALGGTSIVAEMDSASHEGKFIKPLTHNSINWAIGRGTLLEDDTYENTWYYYQDGVKYGTTLAAATELLQSSLDLEKPESQAAA